MSAGIEMESTGVVFCNFAKERLRSTPGTARMKNGPAGKATGHFLNILLTVSAINPESVKLHQLPGVVLVYSPASLRRGRTLLGLARRRLLRPSVYTTKQSCQSSSRTLLVWSIIVW